MNLTSLIEVSLGELVDKLTILEIKKECLVTPEKLQNVEYELHSLSKTLDSISELISPEYRKILNKKKQHLKSANFRLWNVEEHIRIFEKTNDFGNGFIELVRSVYRYNDKRSAIKRDINKLFKSKMIEEKSYGDNP